MAYRPKVSYIVVEESVVFVTDFVYFSKTFRLLLKPSSIEKPLQ